MKFQRNGLKILKNFYHDSKLKSTEKFNPLNPNLEFSKSYMTDLLYGLVKINVKLKVILIENGWLELDTLDDFELYEKMYSNKLLSKFINLSG